MTTKDILSHIPLTLSFSGDNNTRRNNDVVPCGISYHHWNVDDIDSLPNDFDWQEFWKKCKKYYPLHSVAGGTFFNTSEKIIEKEKNEIPVEAIMKSMKTKSENPSVLEIGFGFGGAVETFENCGFTYKGIDYAISNELNKNDDRFIEISESGIPQNLYVKNNFDLVYSTNVFQHLTKQQRIDYYKQIYFTLKKGGVFFFDLFCKNKKKFKELYTEEEEKTLRYATNFFDVHTYVPYPSEVTNMLTDIGFKILKTSGKNMGNDERTDVVEIMARK